MIRRISILTCVTLLLSGCATFDNLRAPDPAIEALEAQNIALVEQQAKNQSLLAQITELRSENEKLVKTVTRLRRASAKLETEQQEASLAKVEEPDSGDTPVITVPAPPKDPEEIIVAQAEAQPLKQSAVPVEASPRLVEPSFVAVETVFENEATGANIPTKSILFGVHLASYRKTGEAVNGWKDLQGNNPDLLGLLEPRVDKVSIDGKGEFFRLIAGGFATEEKAEALCSTLKQKKIYCDVSPFNGERLSIPVAG